MNKSNIVRIVVALMLALSLVAPVYGQQQLYESETIPEPREGPSGEAIIADVIFLRPVGIVAMVVGFVGAIIAYPFAAASNSTDRVTQKLIVEPFEYTFGRPIGDTDYEPPCE